jgi:hypothetical protein
MTLESEMVSRALIDEDRAYLTLFPIKIAPIQKPVKKGKEGFAGRSSQ